MIKVKNLVNDKGTTLANQFIIVTNGKTYFQSYETPIAKKMNNGKVILSTDWDYSNTTRKALYTFLRNFCYFNVYCKKELEILIGSGIIKVRKTI